MMQRVKRTRKWPIALVVVLFLLLGMLHVVRPGTAAPATAPLNLSAYLPIVTHGFGVPTIFGVEMEQISQSYRIDLVQQAGMFWVRRNALLWSSVQPTLNGGYQWSAVAALETELARAPEHGLNTVLIVRGTPGFAQLVPGVACSAIKQAFFDDFGAFLAEVVERYSAAPYFIRHYEIWNEPDIDPSMVTGDEIYGCWGDEDNPQYGGGYYGQMLQVVYPMIKAANPQAQVLIGGLLLDCDPRDPPPGRTCKSSNFLEGILMSGAGNSFDGISFHAYDYYNWELDTYGNPNWHSGRLNGEADGVMLPVGLAKADFIREILAEYNVSGKYLMNTELALLCGGPFDPPGQPGCEEEDTSPYEQMKASFLAQAYATALVDGQAGNFWFSMRGWRNSGLLYDTNTPRPAYFALDFSQNLLAGGRFLSQITTYPDVAIYRFATVAGATIWLAWSTDGVERTITLPSVPFAIWDAAGNSQAVNGTSLTVNGLAQYLRMP